MDVRKGSMFIDIGCGYGAPALMLAGEKGCRVTGVTASAAQADHARERAEDAGLSDYPEFIVADANSLPFPDGTFDGAWFFESIFHIGHETALAEANRILKPKAPLGITDFYVSSSMDGKDKEMLSRFFHVNSLVPIESYREILVRHGFDEIVVEDITANTIRKRKRKHEEAIRAHRTELERIFGGTAAFNEFVDLWLGMSDLIEKHVGYAAVLAGKRG